MLASLLGSAFRGQQLLQLPLEHGETIRIWRPQIILRNLPYRMP
jgi:hypothetical protein